MADNILISTEYDEQCLNAIIQLRNDHLKSWAAMLSKSVQYAELNKWLRLKTPKLDSLVNCNATTRLYWVIHGLTDFPMCPFCHKVKLIKQVDCFEYGYTRACANDCPAMLRIKQQKIEQTCLKKYGVTNYFASEHNKTALRQWCVEHGDGNTVNPFQVSSVKAKAAQSRKEHFGYEYTMQSPEKRKLASENYQRKTGYTHQFKNPDVKQKTKDTITEKKTNGVDIYEKRKHNNRIRRYQKFCENHEVIPNFSQTEFERLDATTQYTTLLSWHCKICGNDFNACIDQNFSSREWLPVRCTHCHPISAGTSHFETELHDFINSLVDDDIIMNTKKVIAPFELDIWLPSKRLAIEFDGLYWHSEMSGTTSAYHLNKTLLCHDNNIQLIHIFEDEWTDKQDIVKSRIKNLLGVYDKTLFARKCEVREVTAPESKEFQNINHIQGAVGAKVHLGLFYDNELVSLMTFGKSRFNKKYEWELLRFCNKLGYHIPGAAGKLLKHFERNWKPKSLVSYADRRWSQGKLYSVIGFSQCGMTSPNYFYYDHANNVRLSRMKFQKHKLNRVLPKFDETKTEIENMHANDYWRIFDCGNFVFEKIY